MKMCSGLTPISSALGRAGSTLALAQIGGEGDDLASIGLPQPFQDDAGVEAAGKGEHDAANGLAHRSRSLQSKGTRRLPPRGRPFKQDTGWRS